MLCSFTVRPRIRPVLSPRPNGFDRKWPPTLAKDGKESKGRPPVRLTHLFTAVCLTALLLPAPLPRAEEASSPDQLKRMYDDTLSQLKDTQQRKTQLASDNEQLKAKVAELQQQLADRQAKVAELQKQNSELAEKAFFLRSHYAAWQEFLHHYPRFELQWKTFLESDLVTPRNDQPVLVDPYWPSIAQA